MDHREVPSLRFVVFIGFEEGTLTFLTVSLALVCLCVFVCQSLLIGFAMIFLARFFQLNIWFYNNYYLFLPQCCFITAMLLTATISVILLPHNIYFSRIVWLPWAIWHSVSQLLCIRNGRKSDVASKTCMFRLHTLSYDLLHASFSNPFFSSSFLLSF